MSSVAKDHEVLTSNRDHAAASSSAAEASRPQPVALEVPVSVNGVRTIAGSEKREPFAETTKTVLIFGNGAVVRLSSSVAPGQLLFLTNDKTRKEVVCQVVKSKNYQNVSGYVELEFTEPVANFWGMRFPAPATTSSSSPVSPASAAAGSVPAISAADPSSKNLADATESETKSKTSNSSRVTGADDTTHATHSSRQLSASAQQADAVAPHGSSSPTSGTPRSEKASNVVEFAKVKASATLAVPESPAVAGKNSSSPAKSILDVEEVKIPSWLEPLARNAAAASAAIPEMDVTQSSGAPHEYEDAVEIEDPAPVEAENTEPPARQVPTSSYGTHFLADEKDHLAAPSTPGSDKKIFIVAVAAAVLIVAGGGAWYVQQQRAGSTPANSSAPVSSSAPSTTGTEAGGSTSSSSQSQPVSSATSPNNVTASGNTEPTPSPSSTSPSTPAPKAANYVDNAATPSANLNKRLATVDSAPEPVAPAPKKPSLGEVNLSAPIVGKRQAQVRPEEALNLESTNAVAEGLGSGLVASSKQPTAPTLPRAVGGLVKVATLTSSVPPLYPANAKAQKVDGDVKLDALVGVNGRVTSVKVISGPTLLRDPAMDAVRHWKYEPAQLDGKAVPMHLSVTVQFKLQ